MEINVCYIKINTDGFSIHVISRNHVYTLTENANVVCSDTLCIQIIDCIHKTILTGLAPCGFNYNLRSVFIDFVTLCCILIYLFKIFDV